MSRNPSVRSTLERRYPIFREYTGKTEACIKFIGSCSVAIIDSVIDTRNFYDYEKANQKERLRKLKNQEVPREYEEIVRLKQPKKRRFPIDFDTKSIRIVNDKLIEEWKNKVICMDCVEGMRQLPDESVDLFTFSPPYDTIRTYNDKPEFDLHEIGRQAHRLLKDGGFCVVVIQDQTKDFAKSLTTFRTTVDWVDNIGFRLFETVIYNRDGNPGAWWSKRFRVDHEYILIFLKGRRPRAFHKEPLMVPSKHAGKGYSGTDRLSDGSVKKIEKGIVNPTKCRGTIWKYATSNAEGNRTKLKHPATYPDALARDIIVCFSNSDDLVVDPMCGSGTTCVEAAKNGRNYIGIEISQQYAEIANTRLKEEIDERLSKRTTNYREDSNVAA